MAASVGLVFSATLFQNLVILTVLLTMVALQLGEALWVWVVTSRRWLFFSMDAETPDQKVNLSKVLYPGDAAVEEFYLWRRVASGSVSTYSEEEFLRISDSAAKGERVAKIRAEFKTPFSGEYNFKHLIVRAYGPLCLFSARCILPVSIKYTVFPRVVQIAVESSKLIGKTGIGETPIDRPGIGTEFYEMTDYSPGDDYRRINWKASARLGKLVVNQKMKEVGGAYFLVLDARSPDYFDRDRLAAAFLQLANALTMLRTPFGVIVHDGRSVLAYKELDLPEESLKVAVGSALDFARLEKAGLPEELMSIPSHKINATRRALQSVGLGLLAELEESARSRLEESIRSDAFGAILDLVRKKSDENERPSIMYVSGMFHSIDRVVELGSEVRRIYSSEFSVVIPTEPWVAAADEESACASFVEHERKLRILRNAGINYTVGEPIGIAQRAFSV